MIYIGTWISGGQQLLGLSERYEVAHIPVLTIPEQAFIELSSILPVVQLYSV